MREYRSACVHVIAWLYTSWCKCECECVCVRTRNAPLPNASIACGRLVRCLLYDCVRACLHLHAWHTGAHGLVCVRVLVLVRVRVCVCMWVSAQLTVARARLFVCVCACTRAGRRRSFVTQSCPAISHDSVARITETRARLCVCACVCVYKCPHVYRRVFADKCRQFLCSCGESPGPRSAARTERVV